MKPCLPGGREREIEGAYKASQPITEDVRKRRCLGLVGVAALVWWGWGGGERGEGVGKGAGSGGGGATWVTGEDPSGLTVACTV